MAVMVNSGGMREGEAVAICPSKAINSSALGKVIYELTPLLPLISQNLSAPETRLKGMIVAA